MPSRWFRSAARRRPRAGTAGTRRRCSRASAGKTSWNAALVVGAHVGQALHAGEQDRDAARLRARRMIVREVPLHLVGRQPPEAVVAAQRDDQDPHVAVERPVEAAQPAGGRVARHARVDDLERGSRPRRAAAAARPGTPRTCRSPRPAVRLSPRTTIRGRDGGRPARCDRRRSAQARRSARAVWERCRRRRTRHGERAAPAGSRRTRRRSAHDRRMHRAFPLYWRRLRRRGPNRAHASSSPACRAAGPRRRRATGPRSRLARRPDPRPRQRHPRRSPPSRG